MDVVYEAEATCDKFHGGETLPWDQVWRQKHEPVDHSRFASLFRLLPGLSEYRQNNLVANYRGETKPSVSGWKKAIPGVIALDIDRDSLDAAVADARRVVERLNQLKVSPGSYIPFLSGGKGFHLQFLPEAFGSLLLEIPSSEEMAHGHERAVLLALRAISGDVRFDKSCSETLRLFRLPNSRHDTKKEHYKVPITRDELSYLDAIELGRLMLTPRPELPTVPSPETDSVLSSLLLEELAKDDERLSNHAIKRPMSSNGLHRQNGQAPPASPGSSSSVLTSPCSFPSSPSEVVVHGVKCRVEKLLQCRPYLRMAWKSEPWPGRDNSRTEFDFRLAKELFILGWDDWSVSTAVQVRPQSNSSHRRSSYLQRTLQRARESADRVRHSRPAASLLNAPDDQCLRSSKPIPDWMSRSQLWRARTCLGPTCLRIYVSHLEYARRLHGWTPKPGGDWSPAYFAARSEFDGEGAMACARTVLRCHELLKASGVLRQLKAGDFGSRMASEWSVRVPCQLEEKGVIRAATAALEVLRLDKKMNEETRLLMRVKAKEALDFSAGGSDNASSWKDLGLELGA